VKAALQVLAGAVIAGAAGNITTLTVLLVAQEPLPVAFAEVLPHATAKTYCACTVWQPGVVVLGEAENAPPSILYWTLNPVTARTVGNVNAALHVLAGDVIAGAAGNITTLTVLLVPQTPVPGVNAAVVPHADCRTYLAVIVWQPGVVGIVGDAE
jgi:hypothetical protein